MREMEPVIVTASSGAAGYGPKQEELIRKEVSAASAASVSMSMGLASTDINIPLESRSTEKERKGRRSKSG
jgi:hypothetical protein